MVQATDPVELNQVATLSRPGLNRAFNRSVLPESIVGSVLTKVWHVPIFSGWPYAIIVTACLDPLKDEAHLYGRKLRAAGVNGRCPA